MVYLPIRQPRESPCVVYRSSLGLSWRIWSMFKTSLLCPSCLGFLGEGLGPVVQECCGFHALTGGDAESFSEAGVHMPIMWRAGPDSPGTMVVICYSMVFQIQQPNFFSLETSCELRFVYAHQFGKRHSPMLFRSDSQIVMCFCKLCWRVRSHKLCCNESKYWWYILCRKHLKPSSCTIWFPAFPLICNQNVGWALQSHRCIGFLSDLTILDPITCDQLPHFLQASNIKVKWIVRVSTFAIYS
jgi:hypothetical protein